MGCLVQPAEHPACLDNNLPSAVQWLGGKIPPPLHRRAQCPLRCGQLDRPPAVGASGPALSGQRRRQHHIRSEHSTAAAREPPPKLSDALIRTPMVFRWPWRTCHAPPATLQGLLCRPAPLHPADGGQDRQGVYPLAESLQRPHGPTGAAQAQGLPRHRGCPGTGAAQAQGLPRHRGCPFTGVAQAQGLPIHRGCPGTGAAQAQGLPRHRCCPGTGAAQAQGLPRHRGCTGTGAAHLSSASGVFPCQALWWPVVYISPHHAQRNRAGKRFPLGQLPRGFALSATVSTPTAARSVCDCRGPK